MAYNIEKFNPSKVFRKIFRDKAHPEAKIEKEIIWIIKELHAQFFDIINYFNDIQEDIKKLAEKVDIVLDIKNLKEKIDKLSF